MKIVTVEQMRRLEQACPPLGISIDSLMENAGLAVARQARRLLGVVAGSRILVLVGSGNNGGDGLVAARHLQRWGARVTVYILLPRPADDPKLRLAEDEEVTVKSSSDDPNLKALDAEMARSRLVIDAVLGTGRARPLEGVVKEALLHLADFRSARSDVQVIALDLPTGLDADTGLVDPACPQADVSVALAYPKVGHVQFPGAERVGRLEVVDIGIPDRLAEDVTLELLTAEAAEACLPRRQLDAHKGTFGHALVIAGSRDFVGAAYLASQAAARVGAGLVTVAAPEGIYPMLASKLTEVIHLPLPQDDDGMVNHAAAKMVKETLTHYDAVMVGCGMGRSKGAQAFLNELLTAEPSLSIPMLIDADGLNNLSTLPTWWHTLKCPTVLTPHPGEMSTLTGIPTSQIQASRIETARVHSSLWGATVVLKGAHTVVAHSDGRCYVSPFANPGLASGGTGDVLSGIIVGLMAQGAAPQDAAMAGVYIHGLAGERIRGELGEAGMLAGDLLPTLPGVLRWLRGTR